MAFFSESLALPENAFLILRDLIMTKTGIYFEESKKDVLADKLSQRVVEKGFNSFLDYYYMLKYEPDQDEEWNKVMDLITVRETYFFRESDHLEVLKNIVLPDFHENNASGKFRIWCAACSTGEEPLSILMDLHHSGWLNRLDIEITASDASNKALESARTGLYRERSLRLIPPGFSNLYFTRENGLWKVNSELINMIKWKRINLTNNREIDPLPNQNVIFCRNVFIYFREETIRTVAESLHRKLIDPGYLFIGVTESLFRIQTHFELVELGKTFVYKK